MHEDIRIGAQRIAAHGDLKILWLADNRHQAVWVGRFGKLLRGHACLDEPLEGGVARHQVGPFAKIVLELPGRNAGVLVQKVAHVLLGKSASGDGFGQNWAQDQQGLLRAGGNAQW